nr:unnamed protein product [Callosobruchus analis]
MYPARADWRDAIRLAEEIDEVELQAMTLQYISPHPNTYTFAKSLSEHTVEDILVGKVPTIIFRPSVGLLRTVYGRRDNVQDFFPCDVVAKLIILATKEILIHK